MKIEISQDKYEYLIQRDFELTCLEDAGVDNWDGYDYAMEAYYNGRNLLDKPQ